MQNAQNIQKIERGQRSERSVVHTVPGSPVVGS